MWRPWLSIESWKREGAVRAELASLLHAGVPAGHLYLWVILHEISLHPLIVLMASMCWFVIPTAFNLWVGMGWHLFTLPHIALLPHSLEWKRGFMLQDVAVAACMGHVLPWECEDAHRGVIPIPAPPSSLHAVPCASGLSAPFYFSAWGGVSALGSCCHIQEVLTKAICWL